MVAAKTAFSGGGIVFDLADIKSAVAAAVLVAVDIPIGQFYLVHDEQLVAVEAVVSAFDPQAKCSADIAALGLLSLGLTVYARQNRDEYRDMPWSQAAVGRRLRFDDAGEPASALSQADVREFLASQNVVDERRLHDYRQTQFRGGWNRHVRDEPMQRAVLHRITWNNLGFRAAVEWHGRIDRDTAFDVFDAVFRTACSAELVPNDEDRFEFETIEGAPSFRSHRRVERSREVVAAAKKHRGARCEACDLNFAEVYGSLGMDYIEAHHLVPLAKRGEAVTNPKKDMRVLCANCHRMIHRLMAQRETVVDVADLKAVMAEARLK